METWKRNLYILMASQFLVMSAMSMVIPFLPLYLKEMGMTDPEAGAMVGGADLRYQLSVCLCDGSDLGEPGG